MSSFSFSLRAAAPPDAAIEIASHRVAAVALAGRGGRASVVAHAVAPLAEGVVSPLLTGPNVRDRGALIAAVSAALDEIGRPKRVGLIVPDPVSKVSIVKFQQVPPRAQDLEQLIRWQVRKAAPFAIEDAQVSFVQGAQGPDGQDFIVTLARRDVIAEYESVCSAAGSYAGLVDVSTFNVINAVLAGAGAPTGDWLLVNVATDWASMAILRGGDLMFFRSRGSEGDGTLADLVHQTAMYYEDRLKGAAFERVMACGSSSGGAQQIVGTETLAKSLEQRLGVKVDAVDPRNAAALTDRIDAAPALLDALAPAVGLLMRDRHAA